MSSKQFYPFKDFQSDRLQRSSHKMFTAHDDHGGRHLHSYFCTHCGLLSLLIVSVPGGALVHLELTDALQAINI